MKHCVSLLAALGLLAAPAACAAEVSDHYDVVVAGAGTGGCGAAIQAVRFGASVLLLEETDWIGGQMNAAAVTSMDEGLTLVRERGLYHELVQRLEQAYASAGKSAETAYWGRHICCEPRVGRAALYAMLISAHIPGHFDLCAADPRDAGRQAGRHGQRRGAGNGHAGRQADAKGALQGADRRHGMGRRDPLDRRPLPRGQLHRRRIDPSRKIQMLTWTAVIKHYPQGVPRDLLLYTQPPGYTPQVHQAFVKTLCDGTGTDFKARPCPWAAFLGYRAMPDSSQPGDWPLVTRTHMNFNNDYEATVADVEDPAHREATCRAARLKTLHLLYYIQHTLGKTDWSVANDEGFDSPYNRDQIDRWLRERPDLLPFRPVLYHFSVMAYRGRAGGSSACTRSRPGTSAANRVRPGISAARWHWPTTPSTCTARPRRGTWSWIWTVRRIFRTTSATTGSAPSASPGNASFPRRSTVFSPPKRTSRNRGWPTAPRGCSPARC